MLCMGDKEEEKGMSLHGGLDFRPAVHPAHCGEWPEGSDISKLAGWEGVT